MSISPSHERSFYPSPSNAESQELFVGRLARIHEECVETARHAELLSRTPLSAYALILGCLTLVFLSTAAVPLVTLGLWALLVMGGAFGILRLVWQTERVSFELAPLRAFALDLNAMLLYAGFAWGAGAFLAIPPLSGALTLEWYAVGAGLAMTAILRSRVPTLCFLGPSMGISLAAALVGPAGPGAAILIIASGFALAASSIWLERRHARRTEVPTLPALIAS
jgi:hypothetical protein